MPAPSAQIRTAELHNKLDRLHQKLCDHNDMLADYDRPDYGLHDEHGNVSDETRAKDADTCDVIVMQIEATQTALEKAKQDLRAEQETAEANEVVVKANLILSEPKDDNSGTSVYEKGQAISTLLRHGQLDVTRTVSESMEHCAKRDMSPTTDTDEHNGAAGAAPKATDMDLLDYIFSSLHEPADPDDAAAVPAGRMDLATMFSELDERRAPYINEEQKVREVQTSTNEAEQLVDDYNKLLDKLDQDKDNMDWDDYCEQRGILCNQRTRAKKILSPPRDSKRTADVALISPTSAHAPDPHKLMRTKSSRQCEKVHAAAEEIMHADFEDSDADTEPYEGLEESQ
jgi:hypothetical protein